MKTPRVSLTTFIDFVNSSGTPKYTRVQEARKQHEEGYRPSHDYWKLLRDRIVDLHRSALPKKTLDSVSNLAHESRRARYREYVRSYKKFLGRKTVAWFSPCMGLWGFEDFKVRVNPELGLVIGDVPFLIKLYFKSPRLAKRKVDTLLLLMEAALKRKRGLPTGCRYGILDVGQARLFSQPPDKKYLPLLDGELSSFATIWGSFDS